MTRVLMAIPLGSVKKAEPIPITAPPQGFAFDCDDTDATVHPGIATAEAGGSDEGETCAADGSSLSSWVECMPGLRMATAMEMLP